MNHLYNVCIRHLLVSVDGKCAKENNWKYVQCNEGEKQFKRSHLLWLGSSDRHLWVRDKVAYGRMARIVYKFWIRCYPPYGLFKPFSSFSFIAKIYSKHCPHDLFVYNTTLWRCVCTAVWHLYWEMVTRRVLHRHALQGCVYEQPKAIYQGFGALSTRLWNNGQFSDLETFYPVMIFSSDRHPCEHIPLYIFFLRIYSFRYFSMWTLYPLHLLSKIT